MTSSERKGPPFDFDDPAEIQRLLREIHEGAERGKAIAAMRPDGAALGDVLLDYIDVFEAWLDNCAYVEADDHGVLDDDHDPSWSGPPWIPADGSPARREHEELVAAGWDPQWLQRDHDQDYGRVLYVVHRYVDAALDHLRGIGILLREAAVIRPPVALARSALEAGAHAHHLCRQDLSATERIAQVLNVEIGFLKEEVTAEQRAKDFDRCRELRSELDALIALGRTNGLPPSKEDRSYFEPRLSARVLTDAVLQQEGGVTWHLLSQFIHPLDDDGWRLVLGPSARTERVQRDALVSQMALNGLLAVRQAREALGWYTGWDLNRLANAESGLLELWAHGAGMRNDVYEAALDQALADDA